MLASPAGQLLAQRGDDAEILLHVYALRHQTAGDALGLVKPLLSPRGTVELRPGDNTLVLRDTAQAIARILPVLVGFDHPSRPVDVELWMVRASGKSAVSPPLPQSRPSNVPPDLLRPSPSTCRTSITVSSAAARCAALKGRR